MGEHCGSLSFSGGIGPRGFVSGEFRPAHRNVASLVRGFRLEGMTGRFSVAAGCRNARPEERTTPPANAGTPFGH